MKPEGLIIYSRSNNWKVDEWEAFKLLNDELHNIKVITFDHLLQRALKSLSIMKPDKEDTEEIETDPEDIPF